MADSALQIIERELIKCSQALFAFYSNVPDEQITVEEKLSNDLPHEQLHCSSIGLAGEEFKVSVVILAKEATIASLCPVPAAVAKDWIGELANQLVGRLKNALCDYGHTGQLSLPVTISGSGLSLWDKTQAPMTNVVHTEVGQVIVRLEAEVDPNSVWTPSEALESAAEGSMCFF